MDASYPGVVTTALVVVSAIFPVISALSIFLRLAARRKSGQQLQSDDYWIGASWVLTFALSILVWVYAAKAGVNYYNVDFLTGTEASLEVCPHLSASCTANSGSPHADSHHLNTADLHLLLLRAVSPGRCEDFCVALL